MKQSIIDTCRKFSGRFILPLTIVLFAAIPGVVVAQADSAKSDAAEEPSLISPSIQFTAVQKGDKTIDLKAILQTKIKGSFIKLPGLKLSFYEVADTSETELGFLITNGVGKAVYNVKADAIHPDKSGKVSFKVKFAGNKAMEAAEEAFSMKRASLIITPVKEDSLLTVKIKLTDPVSAGDTPIAKTTVGIYVKRTFNPLKIGEGTTDENGEATIEIPSNLPGDAKGNIVLMAKLDESETFGNLESSTEQQWGVPVSDKITEMPRALWSSHPPIWMMATFLILMTLVWGHYIVIVIQLFRLRKEEPHPINS